MDRIIKVGCEYKHFEGDIYRVLYIATDSETLKPKVVATKGMIKVLVMPYDKFIERVDKSKYPDVKQTYCFELVTKIYVNDDKEFVNEMRKRLKDNDGYCPCMLIKNEDTKCMCKEFREQEEGKCHCGLYVKKAIDCGVV